MADATHKKRGKVVPVSENELQSVKATDKWDVTTNVTPFIADGDQQPRNESALDTPGSRPKVPEGARKNSQFNRKQSAYHRARTAFGAKKQAVIEQKSERERLIKENAEKRRKQVEERKSLFKMHSKKTKFGQPVMAGRMEKLLERIQNS